jgi:hypothetical protein
MDAGFWRLVEGAFIARIPSSKLMECGASTVSRGAGVIWTRRLVDDSVTITNGCGSALAVPAGCGGGGGGGGRCGRCGANRCGANRFVIDVSPSCSRRQPKFLGAAAAGACIICIETSPGGRNRVGCTGTGATCVADTTGVSFSNMVGRDVAGGGGGGGGVVVVVADDRVDVEVAGTMDDVVAIAEGGRGGGRELATTVVCCISAD